MKKCDILERDTPVLPRERRSVIQRTLILLLVLLPSWQIHFTSDCWSRLPMESSLSSTDGKYYCQIYLRLMPLLKQKPFPHQSGSNVISQQTPPTCRLSHFLLHSPVLAALPWWHSSPLLSWGSGCWQKWCSILLVCKVTPVLLPFSVIFTIPKANDLHCLESVDVPWGFASTGQCSTSRERRCCYP